MGSRLQGLRVRDQGNNRITHADSFDRSPERPGRPARPGRAARARRRRSGRVDRRFARFPKLQLIDLDAAKGTGDNAALVRRICAACPAAWAAASGAVERAQAVLAAGATQVIVGIVALHGRPAGSGVRRNRSRRRRRRARHRRRGRRGGQVAIHGWRTCCRITAVDAVRALEPFCGEFLYTHVDNEGLMQGTDMDAIRAVRDATRGASSPPAASRRGRRSTRSTAWASTPWSAWRSTPGGWICLGARVNSS